MFPVLLSLLVVSSVDLGVHGKRLQREVAPSNGLRAHPSSLSLSEGQKGVFFCKSNDLKAEVQWTKKGGLLPVLTKENNGKLSLFELKVADSGDYVCAAVGDQAGSISPVTVELTVVPEDKTVNESTVQIQIVQTRIHLGQTGDLRCDVPPNSVVTWAKIDGVVPTHASQRDGVLYLGRVEAKDAGFYECKSGHEADAPQNVVQLIVTKGDGRSAVLASTLAPVVDAAVDKQIKSLQDTVEDLKKRLEEKGKELEKLRANLASLSTPSPN